MDRARRALPGGRHDRQVTCVKISDTEARGITRPWEAPLRPAWSARRRLHGLRGYLVADGRMGPFAVVVGLDELDGGVLGVGPGGKAPAIAHLILQGREERLGHGVVVAVSGAAAGKPHVVGPRPFGQGPAGVLGTPIAVEYGISRHVAARLSRLERRHGDVGGHAVRQRPADHHSRAQVDDGGQVEPALAGAQVRDVAHELVGGHGACEVAAHQVGAGLGLRVRDRGPLPGVGRAAAYPRIAHQLQHPVARKVAETRRQHRVHEAEAEPAVGFQPHAHHGVALGGPIVSRAAVREP